MTLWGEPGAMIDTLTTDDLTCNNHKHHTLYCDVLSVQATVQLHEQVNGIIENCTMVSLTEVLSVSTGEIST